MAIISLHMDRQDEKLIKNYAKSKNMSVSSFLHSIAIEKIEDEIDNQLYEKSVREFKDNRDITLDELRKEMDAYC